MALSTVEVVCAPYTLYLAVTGTAFPDVDTTPGAGWTLLGTSGDKSYDEKGVTVTFDESLGTFKAAGTTGNRKVWRISEDITVGVDIADTSAATFAKLLNDATVSHHAAGVGTPGYDSVPLLKGTTVALFALLVKGISPADETLSAQFQLPIVYQSGKLAPVYSKQGAAMLGAQFQTLEDDSLGFGDYIVETHVAS